MLSTNLLHCTDAHTLSLSLSLPCTIPRNSHGARSAGRRRRCSLSGPFRMPVMSGAMAWYATLFSFSLNLLNLSLSLSLTPINTTHSIFLPRDSKQLYCSAHGCRCCLRYLRTVRCHTAPGVTAVSCSKSRTASSCRRRTTAHHLSITSCWPAGSRLLFYL